MSAREALRAAIGSDAGLPAGVLGPPGAGGDSFDAGPARIAASGPRAAGDPAEYELVMNLVYEGYLLHYGPRARLVDGSDPDLALLAGDRLYALGLERLAALGDLDAVSALADVISLCARAHAGGDPELADAAWAAGAAGVGWGASPTLHAAWRAARGGAAGSAQGLVDAARNVAQPR